jgi:fructosamine-3-kinase
MNFQNSHLDHLQFLESILFEAIGHDISVEGYQFLAGGDCNVAVKVETSEGSYFVKWNEQADDLLFASEAAGLLTLKSAAEIKVPEVIGYGLNREKAYLILEFVESQRPHPQYWTELGHSLARLHTHTAPIFGLSQNNFIGTLIQNNEPHQDWITFFVEKRLKAQAGLAYYNGRLSKTILEKFENLYANLPNILPANKPSLLHGDLWSGNVLVGNDGKAWLIDPAVYYGCREAELAFTKLFGGFDPEFYHAYEEVAPLQPGFEQRVEIYNLYPLLVHVNLFGAGYVPGVERVVKKF